MIFHYKSPSIVTVRTTHTQGAPVHTPGPEVPGGCVNSWSLILDSLTDPRGHQEDAFLVVVTEPLMRETPLPPRKVHVGVWKGSLFTSLPPWTWVPTPSPPGRKQLQAWLHAVWHESHRMEKKKKSITSKSPAHEPDCGAELCHLIGRLGPVYLAATQVSRQGFYISYYRLLFLK